MHLKLPLNARQRGSALIEIAMSYSALVIVSILSLKASISTTSSQAWTVKQAMTDAYISTETALAARIPFEMLIGADSPWPAFPNVSETQVIVGKLPGGNEVFATLHRTRLPDSNNLASSGGSGTSISNPSNSEAWKLESILVFEANNKDYVKSRTTLRVR